MLTYQNYNVLFFYKNTSLYHRDLGCVFNQPFNFIPTATFRYDQFTKLLFMLFFKQDPILLGKWERSIKRGDKQLSSADIVCERHFQPEFIIKYDELLLSNGDLFRSKRVKPKLKNDAIPTIFPEAPKYMTRYIKIRKPPTCRTGKGLAKRVSEMVTIYLSYLFIFSTMRTVNELII